MPGLRQGILFKRSIGNLLFGVGANNLPKIIETSHYSIRKNRHA